MFTFFDIVVLKANVHGFRFLFGTTAAPGKVDVSTRLVTSPLQSKILAIVLAKRVRKWEEEHGDIVIPPDIANTCGISPTEDW